jgi:hypothetical protein
MNPDLLAGIEEMETAYGLAPGFVRGLYSEDDWSFVIKGHALIEAAVSGLLTAKVGSTELSPIFQRLELSNKETGKLAFVKALSLLSGEYTGFIRKFSELRNDLVHNVRNTSFVFGSYIAALEPGKRKALVDAILGAASDAEHTDRWRPTLITDPKLVVLAAVVRVVMLAKLKGDIATSEHKYITAQMAELERILGPAPDPPNF